MRFISLSRLSARLACLQILAVCCLALFVFLPGQVCALDVPPSRGYVNDYAAMLSAGQAIKLERALQSFDLTDSTQIAILAIDTLAGDSLEDFSIRVVEKWKIGQKGKDNGVLFLVVKKDRKTRIEVGRGLEHILTDLAAGRIVDDVVNPYFKAGRFDEGFEAGVAAIIQTTRGEYKAEPRAARVGQRHGKAPPIFNYLFFGLAMIAFLGSASRPLGIGAGALLLPLLVFLGLGSSIGLLTLLLLVPVGGLGGLLLPLLLAGMLRHRGGGGFYMGGGGFGGSGGFGGFGGGSFGGGGASGDW